MLCIASKLILPWFKFIFLLPGNGKDYENEFKLQKKKYTEISATLPSPQKASILKTMVSWSFNSSNHCIIFFQPDTNCGLLGMLSTDIAYLVIHNWHGKRTTEGHFCPKKFYPLWERNGQWICSPQCYSFWL